MKKNLLFVLATLMTLNLVTVYAGEEQEPTSSSSGCGCGGESQGK